MAGGAAAQAKLDELEDCTIGCWAARL